MRILAVALIASMLATTASFAKEKEYDRLAYYAYLGFVCSYYHKRAEHYVISGRLFVIARDSLRELYTDMRAGKVDKAYLKNHPAPNVRKAYALFGAGGFSAMPIDFEIGYRWAEIVHKVDNTIHEDVPYIWDKDDPERSRKNHDLDERRFIAKTLVILECPALEDR